MFTQYVDDIKMLLFLLQKRSEGHAEFIRDASDICFGFTAEISVAVPLATSAIL